MNAINKATYTETKVAPYPLESKIGTGFLDIKPQTLSASDNFGIDKHPNLFNLSNTNVR